ncbi:hypothetical protein CDG77_26395 [Nostoc sp. 'Peltigera membranacea cyanobiont' 213]|nr:hypothetical protein CDG77_26395 [Nostoc sp. 'Peltigera membranacea cyanobiont' 213]
MIVETFYWFFCYRALATFNPPQAGMVVETRKYPITTKLTQIFHSTLAQKSMNCGAVIKILYFLGSD